jgi:hypothetical protein
LARAVPQAGFARGVRPSGTLRVRSTRILVAAALIESNLKRRRSALPAPVANFAKASTGV